MKIHFSKFLYLSLCVVSLQAGAVTLALSPESQTASTGDSISLDLVIDGLGDFAPESVSSFYLDINFDPAALIFDSYSLGPYLGDLSSGEATDVSYGLLGSYVQIFEESSLSSTALDAMQPGSFTLVTLDFTVGLLEKGDSTTVGIGTIWGLSDGSREQQLTLDGITNAIISNPATSVPEPGIVLLINLGLLGLAVVRNLKRSEPDQDAN